MIDSGFDDASSTWASSKKWLAPCPITQTISIPTAAAPPPCCNPPPGRGRPCGRCGPPPRRPSSLRGSLLALGELVLKSLHARPHAGCLSFRLADRLFHRRLPGTPATAAAPTSRTAASPPVRSGAPPLPALADEILICRPPRRLASSGSGQIGEEGARNPCSPAKAATIRLPPQCRLPPCPPNPPPSSLRQPARAGAPASPRQRLTVISPGRLAAPAPITVSLCEKTRENLRQAVQGRLRLRRIAPWCCSPRPCSTAASGFQWYDARALLLHLVERKFYLFSSSSGPRTSSTWRCCSSFRPTGFFSSPPIAAAGCSAATPAPGTVTRTLHVIENAIEGDRDARPETSRQGACAPPPAR